MNPKFFGVIFFLLSQSALSLCEDSKFSAGATNSTDDRKVVTFVENEGDKYIYKVKFDSFIEQTLTVIDKEDCGLGVLEPSGTLEWKPVSRSENIYEYSWHYNPSGQVYTDKYFCYLYVSLSKEPRVLYNSCSNLVNDPGLPDSFVSAEISNGSLVVKNEDEEVVFEGRL